MAFETGPERERGADRIRMNQGKETQVQKIHVWRRGSIYGLNRAVVVVLAMSIFVGLYTLSACSNLFESEFLTIQETPGLLPLGSSTVYPNPKGNVNDYAGVLTTSDLENLNALVDSVLRQTGVTFAVAIVPDHGDESLEIYSANLYENWGIGEKDEDMGLLVVLSMEERGLRMEVGYGLEPVITDGRAGECLDKMLPYFRNEEYGKGLYAGLLNAAQYVADEAGIELQIEGGQEGYLPPVFSAGQILLRVLAVVFFLVAVLVFAVSRKSRCPKCKSKLIVTDKVIRVSTFAQDGLAVKMFRCPVCGYYRDKTYKTGPTIRPPGPGGSLPPSMGPGPFFGGSRGSRGRSPRGLSGPRGFGGGRSGGGGASRKW
ncbi:MAG TPA: TPM domain-containing protein [Firmicutes bacterium]|nr:TPM domain-containing protein [Bacillota bacterium]